jgi:predicted GNAT family N-acyltransferase
MSSEYNVRELDWRTEGERVAPLRDAVFGDEQQVDPAIQWDGRDEESRHVVIEDGGQAIAYGRLLPEGRIGRLAVAADYRGRGLGRQVLDKLVSLAREAGMDAVHLHAQAQAAEFYLKAGFQAEGEPFDEAGIPHLAMQLPLLALSPGFLTGVSYPHPFDDLAVELVASASRQISILSPTLDNEVFDRRELSEALAALARRGRESLVRILVRDARPIVQRGHRLLQLARRLPSSVRLQKLAEHPDWKGETIVIRDRDGVLYKPGDADHEGFYEPDSRASTQKHADLFEELWRHSTQDVEFRSFSL